MTEGRNPAPAGQVRRGGRGFTLIEVLVALTILALALVPLLRIYSGGAKGADRSDHYLRASAVAESLLASAGSEYSLQEGEITGRSARIFDWTLTIRPYQPELNENSPLELFEVEAAVRWTKGARTRGLTLTTLRAAQRAAS